MPKKPKQTQDHFLSFKKSIVPPIEGILGISYDDVRNSIGPDLSGFADFISTKGGAEFYRRPFPGYAPVVNEYYQCSLWDACGRIVVRPSKGLFQMLLNTESNVPLSMVHSPYPSVCIDVPVDNLIIPDPTDGTQVVVECIYVACGPSGEVLEGAPEIHTTSGDTLDKLDFQCRATAVGRTRDQSGDHPFVIRYQTLTWKKDDERTVEELVEHFLKKAGEEYDKGDDAKIYATIHAWKKQTFDEVIIRLVVNLLLYMMLPDADILKNPSELYERLRDLKARRVSTKRRNRVKRQIAENAEPSQYIELGRSIVISPETVSVSGPEAPADGSRKSPKPHWRKGHFRTVRYGEKRSRSKIAFIKPVLVRKDAAGGDVSSRPYDVK